MEIKTDGVLQRGVHYDPQTSRSAYEWSTADQSTLISRLKLDQCGSNPSVL